MSYEEAVKPNRQLKSPPPDPPGITVNPIQSAQLPPKYALIDPERHIEEQFGNERQVVRSNSIVSKKSTASEVSRMIWDVSNLPKNADPNFAAWGLFDHNGGRLSIPDSDVTLTIPHLAIPKGKTEAVYIALMKQDGEFPTLNPRQALLSPVIICGPNGLKFNRTVILSMPHSALLDEGAWKLQGKPFLVT